MGKQNNDVPEIGFYKYLKESKKNTKTRDELYKSAFDLLHKQLHFTFECLSSNNKDLDRKIESSKDRALLMLIIILVCLLVIEIQVSTISEKLSKIEITSLNKEK